MSIAGGNKMAYTPKHAGGISPREPKHAGRVDETRRVGPRIVGKHEWPTITIPKSPSRQTRQLLYAHPFITAEDLRR